MHSYPALIGSVELAEDVGFLLARAGSLAIRSLNRALEPYGMRARHYAALCLAAEGEGVRQRTIGTSLGLDPSQVVALVDDLERLGLVSRRPDPSDRRTRLVVVSPRGRQVRDEGRRAAHRVHEQMLAAVDGSDQRHLVVLLQAIVADQVTRADR